MKPMRMAMTVVHATYDPESEVMAPNKKGEGYHTLGVCTQCGTSALYDKLFLQEDSLDDSYN